MEQEIEELLRRFGGDIWEEQRPKEDREVVATPDTFRIVHKEEFYTLLPKWLQKIIVRHGSYGLWDTLPVEIQLRVQYGMPKPLEVDMVVKYARKRTTIGFELKENDYQKACQQALERRKYFTFFYIVLGYPVASVFNLLKDLRECILEGCGIVSADDDIVVIWSKTKRSNTQHIASLMEYIGKGNDEEKNGK